MTEPKACCAARCSSVAAYWAAWAALLGGRSCGPRYISGANLVRTCRRTRQGRATAVVAHLAQVGCGGAAYGARFGRAFLGHVTEHPQ